MLHGPVGAQQLDLQLRVLLAQGRQHRGEHVPREGRGAGHPQAPRRRLLRPGHRLARALQVALQLPHLLEVQRAALGQRQAARGPVQQTHAQMLLQTRDVLADRGRTDPQQLGASGNAAGIDSADKATDGLKNVHWLGKYYQTIRKFFLRKPQGYAIYPPAVASLQCFPSRRSAATEATACRHLPSSPLLRPRWKLGVRTTPFVFAFYMAAIMALLMCLVITGANTGLAPATCGAYWTLTALRCPPRSAACWWCARW